jgi:lactoylglutathione lyase
MSDLTLGYVILYVPDVTKAIEFYERAFGLKRRFIHESGQYAELETGATALSFAAESDVAAASQGFVHNRLASKPAGVEVALVTREVHAAFQKAVGAGATAMAEPEAKPWGQVVSYVRDLNGFLVELCSPVSG